MSERLAGIHATVVVDGKQVSVDQSTDLSSLNAATLKALRKADALVKVDESDESEAGDGDPESPGVPDVAVASVEEVSAWLVAARPNAQATVDLAGSDPVLARKVIDAENHAQGGDGRTTVVTPLRGVIDAAGQTV